MELVEPLSRNVVESQAILRAFDYGARCANLGLANVAPGFDIDDDGVNVVAAEVAQLKSALWEPRVRTLAILVIGFGGAATVLWFLVWVWFALRLMAF